MTEATSRFAGAIRLPSAKFPTIGDFVEGVVIAIEDADVPHFNDKGRVEGVEHDEDGSVKQQLDVTLETSTGSKVVLHTGGAIFYAIGRALAEVGSDDLVEGDKLIVAYTGDGEATAKGRNAPKQYNATVTKA